MSVADRDAPAAGGGSAAPKLKDLFDEVPVRALASDLASAHPSFDRAAFVRKALDGLDRLELLQRAWHLAEALRDHLPRPFAKAAEVLLGSLGPELSSSNSFGLSPLRYMPHIFFVQKYGLEDFEVAMRLQYELTKRFSAESSIRAFLVKHPQATYARLRAWTRDENVHVRRLVSEGTRPRLPWAPRLRAFQEDPRPVTALLDLLKDDPERYVQRSVANNLNDIAKDHPDLAIEVCRRWWRGASPRRRWIVRHGLRSLVKKAHPGALELLGVGAKPRVAVSDLRLSPRIVPLGDRLRFSCTLTSTAAKPQQLIVDYVVHFAKARGTLRPKVFKLRKLSLLPKARVELGGTVSFEHLTTRRPYPGRHKIDLLINGVVHPLAAFEVTA